MAYRRAEYSNRPKKIEILKNLFFLISFGSDGFYFVYTQKLCVVRIRKKFNCGFNTFTDSNNKRNVDYDDDGDDYDEGSRGDILIEMDEVLVDFEKVLVISQYS